MNDTMEPTADEGCARPMGYVARVGDKGLGTKHWCEQGRRCERITVEITEVHGPVLTVRWRTSWNRRWKENYLMALKDFTPDVPKPHSLPAVRPSGADEHRVQR